MHRIRSVNPIGLALTTALSLWVTMAAYAQSAPPPQTPALDPPALTRGAVPAAPASTQAAAAETTAYSHGDPTAEEQYMLELVNRARANPTAEGLRLRYTTDADVLAAYSYFDVDLAAMAAAFAGYPVRPPLAFNANLIAAARAHSQDMASNNFQGHTGSTGSTMQTRIDAAGYTGWNALAENVYAYAKGVFYGHAGFNADWGVPSLGHRQNIMNFSTTGPVYTEIGIGIVPETSSATGVGPLVVTEDFGRRNGEYFVVGVVYADADGDAFYGVGEGLGGIMVSTTQGNYAYTSSSGGYAIPLASTSGSITVHADGPALGAPQARTVALAGTNVKVDFIAGSADGSPVLLSSASRKAHGAAGTFDLPLALTPANPATEPRSGGSGGNHVIVFTFDRPVVAGAASVTSGTAVAGAPTFSGNEMWVPLSGVGNPQYVTVAVSDVAAAGGGTAASGSVRVGFLLGDVNRSRAVTVADLAQVNAQVAQPVTAANFVHDLNASGTITVADKGVANTQVAKALPAP
jgi:uncharacterized protein YkwD